MATAISSIHDELHTVVAAALPAGYRLIPNAYITPENVGLYLRQGYGIAVGPGNNTERIIGGKKSYQRDFQVFLTRELMTTSTNTEARQTVEKQILEDFDTVLKAIEENPTLNGNAGKTVLINDGGLEYLESDRAKYFLIETTVTVEYLENVNC